MHPAKRSPPRNPRNTPAEQVDEAPGVIEREQVEIERDIPADDNEPIERVEPPDELDARLADP